MKKKTKFIEVTHPFFETPIKISVTSEEEFHTIVTNCANWVRSFITSKGSKDKISVLSYQYSIVKLFVLNYQEIYDAIVENNPGFLTEDGIISVLYDVVMEFYSALGLDLIFLGIIQTDFATPFQESEMKKRKIKPTKESNSFLEEEQITNTKKKAAKEPTLPLKTKEDLEALDKLLASGIIGQSEAIKSVVDSLKLLVTGFCKHTSFLFLGPTGVGKTQLSKYVGQAYGNKFIHINCAEFVGGHEVSRLLGSPPGYIGSNEQPFLTAKAEEGNAWVFLFDEIEKANFKLWNFLLALLEEGKVNDNHGRELDFTRSIFIMTSNQGVSDLKYDKLGFSKGTSTYVLEKDNLTKSLEKQFAPEFLNRIDHIVTFNQLSKDDIRKIIDLESKTLPIKMTDEFYNFVLDNAYDPKYNARNIKRFIKREVMVKLAEAKLAGVRRYASKYRYKIEDNKFNVLGLGN